MKIAALADFHYALSRPVAERRSELAPLLLARAVARLNRFIRPDVTVLLGDLLDRGAAEDGSVLRSRLQEIISKIESPVIVIPGNHDGNADAFYKDFVRPPSWVDIAGVRFVTFDDPVEPRHWARRTDADLARLRAARADFDGEIVALQHLPLHPPESTRCPYNLTNAEATIATMREVGVRLSIGAHYHAGMDIIEGEGDFYIGAPALCETPFSFLVIEIDGDSVVSKRQDLAVPRDLGLFDHHVHTQFAYCSQDMDISSAVELRDEFGLAGLAFAEHTGQLYFGRREYWRGDWYSSGIAGAPEGASRMAEYLAATAAADLEASAGFEVDFDKNGRAVMPDEVIGLARPSIGTVHHLTELARPEPDSARAADEHLALAKAIAHSGVSVLAHPFRVYQRKRQPVPSQLFEPVAKLLRETGVAAEINFHGDTLPQREFIKLCLDMGVRLALGSDAHALWEVGDFWPHLRLLEDLGVSDPRDVLVSVHG